MNDRQDGWKRWSEAQHAGTCWAGPNPQPCRAELRLSRVEGVAPEPCGTLEEADPCFSSLPAHTVPAARADCDAAAQRALAHISDLTLTLASPSGLYEEALRALFDNVAGCKGGIIVELAGGPGDYDVVASRGLGADPLGTLRCLGDATALVDAAAQRGCVVSQAEERDAGREPAAGPMPRPGRVARPLSWVGRGFACPISAEGEVLGVVALYGRDPIDAVDCHHFALSVANVLGAALLRQRTRRRLDLELAVSHELAGALDMNCACERIRPALGAALGVEELEIWTARDSARDDWERAFPSPSSASPARPWSSDILGAPYTEAVFRSGDVRELLLPIQAGHLPPCVLSLRGKGLRRPDSELSEGLKRIGRLIGDFLERLQILERARQSELAYRQKSAELDALYASLPVGVSIHDQSGAIRKVNGHLAALHAPPGRSGLSLCSACMRRRYPFGSRACSRRANRATASSCS